MSGGGGVQPQQGNQSSYSRLQGQWTFNLTYTMSGLHLYELQTRWGATVDVLADPQFQWTPSVTLSPAQWALSAHLLNVQWPRLGPIVVQTFIDGQFQVTNGQGQTSVVAGVQLAPRACQSISIGGQVLLDVTPGPAGLSSRVDPQAIWSVALSF